MMHIRSRPSTHELAREARHDAANAKRKRDRAAQITRGRPSEIVVLPGSIPPYLVETYERIRAINQRFDADTAGIIHALNPMTGGYLYDIFTLLEETTCPPAIYEGFRCLSILTSYSNDSNEIRTMLPRERVDYVIYMIERIVHLSKDAAIIELAVSILGQLLGHGLIHTYTQVDKYKESTQMDLMKWLIANGNNTTAVGRYAAWFLANACLAMDDVPPLIIVTILQNMERYLADDDPASDPSLVSTTFSIFAGMVKKMIRHERYGVYIIPHMVIRCLTYVMQTSNEPATILEWKSATVAVIAQNPGSEIFLDDKLASFYTPPFVSATSDEDTRVYWKVCLDMIGVISNGDKRAYFPNYMYLVRLLSASYRNLADVKDRLEVIRIHARLLYLARTPEDVSAIVGSFDGFPSIFTLLRGTVDMFTFHAVANFLHDLIDKGYPKLEIHRQWEGLAQELESACIPQACQSEAEYMYLRDMIRSIIM